MKIDLDNCCFNRPFDDQSYMNISLETQAKLMIQTVILDYTKWQQEHFDNMSLETFVNQAANYAKTKGK